MANVMMPIEEYEEMTKELNLYKEIIGALTKPSLDDFEKESFKSTSLDSYPIYSVDIGKVLSSEASACLKAFTQGSIFSWQLTSENAIQGKFTYEFNKRLQLGYINVNTVEKEEKPEEKKDEPISTSQDEVKNVDDDQDLMAKKGIDYSEENAIMEELNRGATDGEENH